jgi:organic radical activating enzyme
MKISNIFSSLGTEFPNRISLVISVSGCDGNCENCHSQEMKNWDIGYEWHKWAKDLDKKLNDDFFDSIVIIGGDIIDNYKKYKYDVLTFINYISRFNKNIFFYTRYEKEDEIIKDFSDEVCFIIEEFYLKTGAYIEKLNDKKYWLGSVNQKTFYIKNNNFKEINLK